MITLQIYVISKYYAIQGSPIAPSTIWTLGFYRRMIVFIGIVCFFCHFEATRNLITSRRIAQVCALIYGDLSPFVISTIGEILSHQAVLLKFVP
jgi:hypothetical protein